MINKKILFLLFLVILLCSNRNIHEVNGNTEKEIISSISYTPHESDDDLGELFIELDGGPVRDTWFIIPPDAKIKEISLDDYYIENYGELFFRSYKWGYVDFIDERVENKYYLSFNVTYEFNQPFQIKNNTDLLSDTFMDHVIEEYNENMYIDANYQNIQMAKEWSGYPVYNINKNGPSLDSNTLYQYVIIIPEDWVNELQDFISLKESKGLRVFVATLEWIETNYFGASMEKKMREFLKDAFNSWKIQYALLAGGINIIPSKYIQEATGVLTPTDAYFSCLDGDWITTPVDKYLSLYQYFVPLGDWFPEIVLGRLPADNIDELRNMLQKIVNYEQCNPIEDWHKKVLSIEGERYQEPWYYENMIDFSNLCSREYVTTLRSGENSSAAEFLTQMNSGQSVVTGTAHGGTLLAPGEYLHSNLITSLQNIDKPTIWLLEGCRATQFWEPSNFPTLMMKQEEKGSVACLGSAWGLGMVMPNRYFFGMDAPPNSKGNPGIAFYHGSAKESCGGSTFVFLGDPEMSSWTGLEYIPQPKLILEKSIIPWNSQVKIKIIDEITGLPIRDTVIRLINTENDIFLRQ